MKLLLSHRPRQHGAVILLIIVVLVFFLILVGTLFYVMCKAVHKVVPPPPNEGSSFRNPPPIGSKYAGGTVQQYVGSVNNLLPVDYAPTNFCVDTIYIYAGDTPATMTNLVFGPIPFSDLDSYIDDRGIPMEQWPDGQQPAQRFFKVVGEGHLE